MIDGQALTTFWFIGLLLTRAVALSIGGFCLFAVVVLAEAWLRRVRRIWTARRR